MTTLEKKITVNVHQGVHGRVATKLAKITQQHNVLMHILRDQEELDCASVLDVLSMGFTAGTSVLFRVVGEKAGQALADVEKLLGASDES